MSMAWEHINDADEIVAVVRALFRDVRVRRFPTPLRQASLYAAVEGTDLRSRSRAGGSGKPSGRQRVVVNERRRSVLPRCALVEMEPLLPTLRSVAQKTAPEAGMTRTESPTPGKGEVDALQPCRHVDRGHALDAPPSRSSTVAVVAR